jgi:acyl-coenzyme A synthetase/AMP-(fatty) acid ligase
VIGNERLTYLQFNDLVNRWANALAALGVGRGGSRRDYPS